MKSGDYADRMMRSSDYPTKAKRKAPKKAPKRKAGPVTKGPPRKASK